MTPPTIDDQSTAGHGPEPEQAREAEGLGLVRLSDVEPEKVRWLWPGRIPLGKLTLLDGDPGLGKSTLTLDLAARVTHQSEMPGGEEPDLDEPAGVVLLTAEDGLADTIRPRLDAAGANVEHVVALRTVPDDSDNPRLPTVEDLEEIHEAIEEADAALVIVDPLTAYIGQGTDTHRDSDVRGALAGLAQLAEEMDVAVLAVRHLNKSQDKKAIYRGGGSIAFTASARSVLLVAEDPNNPSRQGRVLAQVKGNLARQQRSLAFHLQEEESGDVRISWDGSSPHDAADLLRESGASDATPREQAKHWLQSELAGGPVPAQKVLQRAKAFGIRKRTLRRAKKELGVTSEKEGFEKSQWRWKLPETEEQDHTSSDPEGGPEGAKGRDVAAFGEETPENPGGVGSSSKQATGGQDGDLREPAKNANPTDSGGLREHRDRTEDLSDPTGEDGHDTQTGEIPPDGSEVDRARASESTDRSATIPVSMVDGTHW